MGVELVLFTRDLRVHDHPALTAAVERAEAVVPLFVLDDDLLVRRGAPNRVAFLLESLADLRAGLRRAGGDLVVRRGDTVAQVLDVATSAGVERVHCSADVSAWAHRREGALRDALGEHGIELVAHEGVTVVPAGALTPTGGDHYKVFTPYFRQWRTQPWGDPLPAPRALRLPDGVWVGDLPDEEELGKQWSTGPSPQRPPGGERAGRDRLDDWLAGPVQAAGDAHDDLAHPGTSQLSAYLRFGCVSPRAVAVRAATVGEAAEPWLRQLCWRDFLHQVTDAFGAMTTTEYRTRSDRWLGDSEEVEAWRQGRTGVPIVDAGMRQLRAEGWMHNRARLITASFLTKHLYADWRLGAEHFWWWLVDGDVANNYGGWQWVAGTGNDTRPNRVLNPLRQAERFDPSGDYVRRWVPELAAVEGSAVQQPWRLPADVRATLDYPDPIIDVEAGADRFLRARPRPR